MRKITKYKYNISEGVDECFNPCKILNITLIFDDNDIDFISDITIDNDEEDFIKSLCVETIENYGYEIV